MIDVCMHRRPAITLAQQAKKIGAATIDFFQTNAHDLTMFRLFTSHSPAQIDLGKFHLSFPAGAPNCRKNLTHQIIPLFLHVSESGRNEDADFTGVCFVWHEGLNVSLIKSDIRWFTLVPKLQLGNSVLEEHA